MSCIPETRPDSHHQNFLTPARKNLVFEIGGRLAFGIGTGWDWGAETPTATGKTGIPSRRSRPAPLRFVCPGEIELRRALAGPPRMELEDLFPWPAEHFIGTRWRSRLIGLQIGARLWQCRSNDQGTVPGTPSKNPDYRAQFGGRSFSSVQCKLIAPRDIVAGERQVVLGIAETVVTYPLEAKWAMRRQMDPPKIIHLYPYSIT